MIGLGREASEPGTVVVHGSATGFAQTILAGRHALTADEPISVGGTDTGPNPYDLLLAALGSCTSMTLAMYARRKNWPLDAVTIRLRHAKIHAADCEACETKDGRLDYVEREVELTGVLSEEQRARLLDIANKCPVHRMLKAEIHIETRLTAGVNHVVKVSAFAASDHSRAPIGRWHYQVEKDLQGSGMAWTMLRPHHFMQNLLAQAEYVEKDGAIYSPSGDGKIPYVDGRDVGAVAAVTLTTPGHSGKTYVVTGSEAMSYRQASEIIAAVIGKPVRFVDELPEQARARRIREGVPPTVIESILAIGAYQRAGGKTVTITSTIADLTGRQPRTVAEFVREPASAFCG